MERAVRGILLVAHGSIVPGAERDVEKMAGFLREQGGADVVEVGYLGETRPDLVSAVHACARQGVRELVILPYFLTAGFLVRKAVRIAQEAASGVEGLEVRVAGALGPHPFLVEVVRERIAEAKEKAQRC